ncbi:GGDEF domain-containing protein [Limosilactobacillus ingluviei]|uniref:GGDEF domain-containing protein n=1 Tax=Limosilactobacillus ingluviei DSM 15946 TaxID=1423760 RepID=A0A0R1UDA2_9LACO|nr:diguanylate cyclase [Limosilactobacillus ingluviei]KRL91414.1 hypothetical protein FC43_GL001148 [Limosilactobacillus ingluviei DSM 15946]
MSNDKNHSLSADIYIILLLACSIMTAIFVGISANLMILNCVFLAITCFLVLVTYFVGLLAGLIFNLLFIFVQGSYVLYADVVLGQELNLWLIGWLFWPLLWSVLIHLMTNNLRDLQAENQRLKEANARSLGYNSETDLRTMRSYRQDAEVFIETHKRFAIPVATGIISIRYFRQIMNLLTTEQQHHLVKRLSKILADSFRNNDIVYSLEGIGGTPQWAVLLFADYEGAMRAMDRIKQRVTELLQADEELGEYEIQISIGVVEYDPDKIANISEFIAAAQRVIQYDV